MQRPRQQDQTVVVGAEADAVTVWDIGSAADDAGAETSKTAVAAQDQAVVAGG